MGARLKAASHLHGTNVMYAETLELSLGEVAQLAGAEKKGRKRERKGGGRVRETVRWLKGAEKGREREKTDGERKAGKEGSRAHISQQP